MSDITPARKFLMLRILTRSVSEGYTPGPSLTLRVSMTFFVAGVIAVTMSLIRRSAHLPIRTRNAVRSRRLAVGTSKKVHEYKNDERSDCSDRS